MSSASPTPDEPTAPLGDGGGASRDPAAPDGFRTLESGSTARAGDTVGPYKLVSQIGEGGFGEVWMAERREPFTQRVALKLIKPGMDSRSVIARFEQERQALAVMNHPHIAKVLDGGLTKEGRPYFAMEYVKGEPITEFCDARKLGIEERLSLFVQACEAIQHAHLKGIVHRDIKPSNILAFMVEGEGPKLKVIDFGVAKAMSQPLTDRTIFTETGQMIGTVEYMSPEQADPTAGDIDTRSDIYSLGVLLYELLVGATPFDPKDLRRRAYGEIQRIIREQDPPTPSARLSTMGTRDREASVRIESSRRLRMADLVRRLRGELEWIPLKAMRKEPQHRYQTAIELARDVRDYLEGKPISAVPESAAYRLRKYMRRNRALVAGAGAVFGALVVGLALATWQYLEADAARVEADTARVKAIAEKENADAASRAADMAQAVAEQNARQALEEKANAERALRRVEEESARANDFLAAIAANGALAAAQSGRLDQFRSDIATLEKLGRMSRFDVGLASALMQESISEREWGVVGSLSRGGRFYVTADKDFALRVVDFEIGLDASKPMAGNTQLPDHATLSPDGRVLASVDENGVLHLWSTRTATAIGEPLGLGSNGRYKLQFSPDGSVLAASSFQHTRLFDARTARPLSLPETLRPRGAFAFAPKGSTVAIWSGPDEVTLWNFKDGRVEGRVECVATGPIWDGPNGPEYATGMLLFSPDGRTLYRPSERGAVEGWDLEHARNAGNPIRRGQSVTAMAVNPKSGQLAVGYGDGAIRIASAPRPLEDGPRTSPVACLAFSRDGAVLASGSRDGAIQLFGGHDGAPLCDPLRGHGGGVESLRFSGDGLRLVSMDESGFVLSWSIDLAKADGWPERPDSWTEPSKVAFRPGKQGFAVLQSDGSIQRWDTVLGRPLGGPTRPVLASLPLAALPTMSGDGRIFFYARQEEDAALIERRDAASGRTIDPALRLPPGEPQHSIGCSIDGSILAGVVLGEDFWSTVFVIDASSGKVLCERRIDPDRGRDLKCTLSPDGSLVLISMGYQEQEVLDTRTGASLWRWQWDPNSPDSELRFNNWCRFSPTGDLIAAESEGKVTLIDARSGTRVSTPIFLAGSPLTDMAFSPDGKLLAVIRGGISVQLFDVATGRVVGGPILELEERTATEHALMRLCFSPDGRMLAVVDSRCAVRFWHTDPVAERIDDIEIRRDALTAARALLRERLRDALDGKEPIEEIQSSLQEDARFSGDMRLGALLAIGEASVGVARDRIALETRIREMADKPEELAGAFALIGDKERKRVDPDTLFRLMRKAMDRIDDERLAGALDDLQRCAEELARRGWAVDPMLARIAWRVGDRSRAVGHQRKVLEAARAEQKRLEADARRAQVHLSGYPDDVVSNYSLGKDLLGKEMRRHVEEAERLLRFYETEPVGTPPEPTKAPSP